LSYLVNANICFIMGVWIRLRKRGKTMLGNYAEVVTVVEDVAAAVAFYARLGFKALDADTLTDGCINLQLVTADMPTPTLAFYGSDPAAVRATGITLDDASGFTAPGGLYVRLHAAARGLPMPAGTPLSRENALLGKMGELSCPVADAAAAFDFWTGLGLAHLHVEAVPYPWGIVGGDLIMLGIHQTTEYTVPTLTYFAPNMPDAIAALRADGVAMRPFPPDAAEPWTQVGLTGPGGQELFLFTGEI
jgi:hypothetical protein